MDRQVMSSYCKDFETAHMNAPYFADGANTLQESGGAAAVANRSQSKYSQQGAGKDPPKVLETYQEMAAAIAGRETSDLKHDNFCRKNSVWNSREQHYLSFLCIFNLGLFQASMWYFDMHHFGTGSGGQSLQLQEAVKRKKRKKARDTPVQS